MRSDYTLKPAGCSRRDRGAPVISAKAGIQTFGVVMDSRLRGSDGF